MTLDIAALVLIALCAALGFRLGFAFSLVKLGGWIGAIIAAIFTHKRVTDFIRAHTSIEEKLNEHMDKICNQFIEKNFTPAEGSEDVGGVTALAKEVAAAAAKSIASHALTIFVFVGIIIVITFIIFILTLMLSKRYNDGFIGFFDGFLGMLFGLVGGAALVMLLLALMMPMKYVMGPDIYEKIDKQLDSSVIASVVYDNNPLLEAINGFMPNDLDPKHWIEDDSEGYVHKNWGELV